MLEYDVLSRRTCCKDETMLGAGMKVRSDAPAQLSLAAIDGSR